MVSSWCELVLPPAPPSPLPFLWKAAACVLVHGGRVPFCCQVQQAGKEQFGADALSLK